MADSVDPLPEVASAGGYGSRYPRRGHYVAHVVIAAVVFVASCLALHAILPFPDVAEVTAKLRYFTEHKDEFDTIFIGSSRIYRQVIPPAFDRVAAEHGTPTHSFNLGAGGMHVPESFYLLDRVLRTKPAKLKWVFVELEPHYPKWEQDERETRRFLYWHDWHLTLLMVGQTANPDGRRSWPKVLWQSVRAKTSRAHLAMFLKNFGNIGRSEDLQGWFAMLKQRHPGSEEFDERKGYGPNVRTMSPRQAEQYEPRLQAWKARARRRFINATTEKGYRDCAEQIRKSGGTVIFVVSPTANQNEFGFRQPDAAMGPILAFNQADKYPAFYDARVRADTNHLTPEGAEMFTRLLAKRFAIEVAATK